MDSRFDTLFLHARELESAEERSEFLDQVCAGDPELRRRLESKLIVEAEAADFFGEAVTHAHPDKPVMVPGEEPGAFIGPFKLLQQIGEGGFGTVWMADQQAPVRRRVALKIIKPGLDTKEVMARFEQERQALAMMDHANIARVFDAGATQSGRPFFVMELVRGTKITDYCDEHGLDIPERVRLFIQVCHAVHHAHQKGIIHRDIKPSNVLVTVNDGEAVVKIIDFGVAKATLGSLTDATLFTQFHQMIGTPAYMSPEQAEMTSLDIDTRSDIYSLGVLLYELITGRTPIDTATLARAGLDEIRRVIRETTPPRPSARMKAMSAGELTTTAKRRRTDGAKLTTSLRGDLDWIAMMCLEKDRKRRYDSANALALDLERYLGHGIVTARPPTVSYLLSRIVRRHRVAFAAAAAVLAALLTGLGIALWQYGRAAAAEREQTRLKNDALSEALRSRQVATLLKDMLDGVNPAQARGRDTTVLRGILDRTASRIAMDLKDQPEVAADLHLTLGQVYNAVGEFPKAAAMDRAALALYRRVFDGPDARILRVLNNLGWTLAEEGHVKEAEEVLTEALAMSETLHGRDHATTARVLSSLGYTLVLQERYAEAEVRSQEALTILQKQLGLEHSDTGGAMVSLGEALAHQHKFPEAEAVLRESLTILRKAHGSDHPRVAAALSSLGYTLSRQGRPDQAEPLFKEALDAERKLYGPAHRKIAGSLQYMAQTLADLGRLPEAESLFREALAMKRKVYGDVHSAVADTMHDLGLALGYQRKFDEAEEQYREALAMKKKLFGEEHPDVATLLNSLGAIHSVKGRHAEAVQTFQDALAMRVKLLKPDHRDVAESYQNLGEALANQGEAARAVPAYRESLRILRPQPGFVHPGTAKLLEGLAGALTDLGRHDEAEPVLSESLALREKLEPEGWKTFYGRALLGACLLAQKKTDAAGPLLEAGCEGMMQRKEGLRADRRQKMAASLEALIKLYTETAQPDKAAAWREKLKDLEVR